MKNKIALMLLASTALMACNQKKTAPTPEPVMTDTVVVDTHNAQNSLDWAGTYEATVPCADCPGIATTIVLNNDGTYQYTATYLERDATHTTNGTIMWHDNGTIIHLKDETNDTKYKVIENGLEQLDQEGNSIESALKDHYIFAKKQ